MADEDDKPGATPPAKKAAPKKKSTVKKKAAAKKAAPKKAAAKKKAPAAPTAKPAAPPPAAAPVEATPAAAEPIIQEAPAEAFELEDRPNGFWPKFIAWVIAMIVLIVLVRSCLDERHTQSTQSGASEPGGAVVADQAPSPPAVADAAKAVVPAASADAAAAEGTGSVGVAKGGLDDFVARVKSVMREPAPEPPPVPVVPPPPELPTMGGIPPPPEPPVLGRPLNRPVPAPGRRRPAAVRRCGGPAAG